ncbi:MAG: hypothetical protein NWE92_12680 [Candidatus Bathyarchaeota archaeon]|nr:hypothetical protein [Candidatus Bathyarchaeota archaeon]
MPDNDTTGKDGEFFVNAGLTENETKVYFTLNRVGPSRIGIIARETGIQRPNLYKIIDSLSLKGLLTKEINSPIVYTAAAPREAVNMLIEQKKAQLLHLEKMGKIVAEKLEKQSKILLGKDNTIQANKFIMIFGKKVILNRLRTSLKETQNNLHVITSKERFSEAIITFAGEYEAALERGVSIRIIVEDYQPTKVASKIIEKLANNPRFEIRFLCPPAAVDTITSISDGKELFTTISAIANIQEVTTMWTNSVSFISVMQSHFDAKWLKAQSAPKVPV